MDRPFQGKVLAVDADGTLISDRRIAPRNNPAIGHFLADGGRVVLCSGRCVKAAEQVLSFCPLLQDGLLCNGGVRYDFSGGTVVSQTEIDRSDRAFVQEAVRRYGAIGIEIPSGRTVYQTNVSKQVMVHSDSEKLEPVRTELERILDEPWNKVLFAPDDPSLIGELICLGEQWPLKQSYLVRTTATLDDAVRQYLELVPCGVDKGQALLDYMHDLGLPEENLYAIGDYYNDLPMLQVAGYAAVTAEAPDEMKRLADFVTGPCSDGAVADFIEYLYTIQ